MLISKTETKTVGRPPHPPNSTTLSSLLQSTCKSNQVNLNLKGIHLPYHWQGVLRLVCPLTLLGLRDFCSVTSLHSELLAFPWLQMINMNPWMKEYDQNFVGHFKTWSGVSCCYATLLLFKCSPPRQVSCCCAVDAPADALAWHKDILWFLAHQQRRRAVSQANQTFPSSQPTMWSW